MKTKKNKLISVMGLSLLALFISFPQIKAEAEPLSSFNLGSSFDKEISDLEKSWMFYTFPLLKFDFSLDFEKGKIEYQPGEKLEMKASLAYKKGEEKEFEKLKIQCSETGKRACSDDACLKRISENCNPKKYSLPFINNIGVFAQIWKKEKNGSSLKGDYLVSEFYVAENLNLKEGTKQEIPISWGIPKNLEKGSYYINLFINGNNAFNLAAYPFSPSSRAISSTFEIIRGEGGIELDKNNILLGDKTYQYSDPVPVVSDNEIKIKIPVINKSKIKKTARINYYLYKWSQENPSDLIFKGEESITISDNGSEFFELLLNSEKFSATNNLKLELIDEDQTVSSANIRFVVRGENSPMFRFLGLANSEDNWLSPVFCPRNAQWEGIVSGKVKISLLDKRNKEIHTWQSNGKFSTDTICFILKKTPNLEDLKFIKLKGEIFNQANELVDSKEIVYDFENDLKPQPPSLKEERPISSFTTRLLIILILLCSSLAVGWVVLRKLKKGKG